MECFVIMPFGDRGAENERRYDYVYSKIIKAPVERAGFACVRATEMDDLGDGTIPQMIQDKLETADLVVADLSELRPSVLYELGIRHGRKRPVLAIKSDQTQNPFNIANMRTILYRMDDPMVTDQAKEAIFDFATKVARKLAAAEAPSERTPRPDEDQTTRTSEELQTNLANLQSGVQSITQRMATLESALEKIDRRLLTASDESVSTHIGRAVQELSGIVSRMSTLTAQASILGLVGIYRTRPDAIEHELYGCLERESEAIGIVCSTMSGLRGFSNATHPAILDLLQRKAKQKVRLRILLTHWDTISSRQEQEMKDKPLDRAVISGELLTAYTELKQLELLEFARVYKGSPTCFTLVCEGQKTMMVNPYPYEREAINSWAIVFRDVPGGAYGPFKQAHLDLPWENKNLTSQIDHESLDLISHAVHRDMHRANEDFAKKFGAMPSTKSTVPAMGRSIDEASASLGSPAASPEPA